MEKYNIKEIKELIKEAYLDMLLEDYKTNKDNNNMDYNTSEYPYNGYKIIKPLTYPQHFEYAKYFIHDSFQDKNVYEEYIKRQNSIFYFCARYDYKSSKEPLSLIYLLLDKKGSLLETRTRDGNKFGFTKNTSDIEKFLGISNFFSIFKPLTKEELKQSQDIVEKEKEDYQKNIKKYLSQGHNIEEILRKAYDDFEKDFDINLYHIIDNNKYNYIDKEGDFLFNEWYDYIWYNKKINLFEVEKDNKRYYIDVNENIVER